MTATLQLSLFVGMVAELFPNGVSHYAIGGLLVGLGTAVIYFGTGIAAGASTFLESTLSYGSSLSRFQQYRPSRDWRVVFTLGIVAAATRAVPEVGWVSVVSIRIVVVFPAPFGPRKP